MSFVKTFKRGGLYLEEKKELSKEKSIETLPFPKELVVSSSQHLGAPATFIKSKGERVERGEVIATPSSFVSAFVHSPCSGTIIDIRKERVSSGGISDAAVIEVDQDSPIKEYKEEFSWEDKSKEELLSLVQNMGIVGMGGATFPTSVKLTTNGKRVEYLVINASECEPYITCDYRLLLEKSDEILEGAMIVRKILSSENTIIAIENNKRDAAVIIEEKIKEHNYPIKVQLLKTRYPEGDEKQLLYAITGREIPSGKLPLDISSVVCNTATTFAIFEGVKLHKPLMERVITVTGEGIECPKNILAPIGTKAEDLITYSGGMKDGVDRVIFGGPMMGFSVPDLSFPMVKGSGGLLLLLSEKEKKVFPCISCGRCIEHCPMGLLPNRMYRYIKNGKYKEALSLGLLDCKECGCCTYSCPGNIPLVQAFKMGKKESRKK